MPKVRQWTIEDMVDNVVDPNTRLSVDPSEQMEFTMQDGPVIVRTRDLSIGRADLEGGDTFADTVRITECLTDLVDNAVPFTSSVKRGGEVFKFSWETR